MKKLISLICTVAMVIGMINVQVNAEGEALFTSGEQTFSKAKDINFGQAYKQNITVEAEYTVSDDTHWTGDANIPFILKSGSTQLGRISIYSKDEALLNPRIESPANINTTAIPRNGKFIIEVDYENSQLYFKFKGETYKKEAYLAKQNFIADGTQGITGLTIGSSTNPGVSVNIKVYAGISNKMKTVCDFESSYTGQLNSLTDFTNSDAEAVLSKDPTDENNTAVKIPAGKKAYLLFAPRDYGYSGLISVKAKMYINTSDEYGFLVCPQEYITGKTTSFAEISLINSDTMSIKSGDNKRYIQSEYMYKNRWMDVEYIIDTESNTIKAYIDGKAINLSAVGGEELQATMPIDDIGIVNKLYFYNGSEDAYIDDLEVTCFDNMDLSSDIFTVDNEKRVISGYREGITSTDILSGITKPDGVGLKIYDINGNELTGNIKQGSYVTVTDSKGIYTVKYNLKSCNETYFYSQNFEQGKSENISGGKIADAPYGRNDKCYKSSSENGDVTMRFRFPQNTGLTSIEFDMCMENNTAFTTVSVLNTDDKEVAKMYLNNQENIAFLAYDEAHGHILSTYNKQWVKIRADFDAENKNVSWYINNRPLQTIPIVLTNMYNDNDNINGLQIGCRKGTHVYVDNIYVYSDRVETLVPTSDLYTVDGKYSMITNVPYGTTVSEFLSHVTPEGTVYSRSIKERTGFIQAGDTVTFYGNGNVKSYAIGLIGDNIKSTISANTVEIFVAPNGDDTNDGSIDAPLKTIEQALLSTKNSADNVVINLRKGIYNIEKTIVINNRKNLTIKSYNNEEVVLIGGKLLNFTAVTDSEISARLDNPAKVVCADISDMEVGSFTQSGWNLPFTKSVAVLTKNGQTQTVARYPNEDYVTTGDIVSANSTTVSFNYTDNAPDTWLNADKAKIWGFFGVDYGGHDVKISDISTENKTVNLQGTIYNAPKKSFKYYYFDVLEELDAPGEYYIDEANKKLYYYPDADLENSRMVLGTTSATLLRFEECDNVKVYDIIFEGGRENGIEINECLNTSVEKSKIKGFGMSGIEIVGGMQCGVKECEISDTGADAIKLYGGDIYTLSPSKHYVRDCDIHDFSKRKTSYTSAVTLAGDGFEISGNNIYSAPHMAIFVRASDVEIFNNTLSDLVQNAKDAGAIYSVDNYTRRGVNIYNNVFDNIKNKYEPDGMGNVKCVYLDNFTSGWSIHNNIFKNSDEGIHMNGGRENEIYDNVFINTKSAFNIANLINTTFAAAPYHQINYYPLSSELWKSRFPGIDEFTTVQKGYPYNSSVKNNVTARTNRAKADYDSYMDTGDNKTISTSDVTDDGYIYDYNQYINKIKPIEPSGQRGFVIGDNSPIVSTIYIPKGATKTAYYFDGKDKQIPDKITSSNETQVSVKDNMIYAVGNGGAYITLTYKGEQKQIFVVTDLYRLNK